MRFMALRTTNPEALIIKTLQLVKIRTTDSEDVSQRSGCSEEKWNACFRRQ